MTGPFHTMPAKFFAALRIFLVMQHAFLQNLYIASVWRIGCPEVMELKRNWKRLLICAWIPLAVGAAAALLTQGSMDAFSSLNKPPLSPPGWLFPVIWTILYVLMGVACWLVATSDAEPASIRRALWAYGLQLFFNFLWSLLFFDLELYLFAFIWLIALWLLILATMLRFNRISPTAGLLFLPYLLWVTFAGYLNYGIYLLN